MCAFCLILTFLSPFSTIQLCSVNRHNMTQWFKDPNFVWPIGNNVQQASPALPQLPESE